ncbi:MAG: DUF4336 domain-containing protein [Pseudobdellovibrio sp.]
MDELVFFENQLPVGPGLLFVRSTLVSLANGHKVLISPINFTEVHLEKLRELKPTAIVAPNCFHHLCVKDAAEKLNIKTLLAAKGLQQKRSDVAWTAEINEQTWPYQNDLEFYFVDGAPKYNECVFYHKKSKTLIVTDLVFNFKNLPLNSKTFFFKLVGTFNKPASSRLMKWLTKDKRLLKQSLEKILTLDFEKIVMAHGDIITENAKEILTRAFQERGLI